jgi:hypothetical protein
MAREILPALSPVTLVILPMVEISKPAGSARSVILLVPLAKMRIKREIRTNVSLAILLILSSYRKPRNARSPAVEVSTSSNRIKLN